MFKIFYVILTDGAVVNKDKEYEIGTGKKTDKKLSNSENIIAKVNF